MNREPLRSWRRQLLDRIDELLLRWSPTQASCSAMGFLPQAIPPRVRLQVTGSTTTVFADSSGISIAGRFWAGVHKDQVLPLKLDLFQGMALYLSQMLHPLATAVLLVRAERDLEDAEMCRGLRVREAGANVLHLLLADPDSAIWIDKAATMCGLSRRILATAAVVNSRYAGLVDPTEFFRVLGVLLLPDAMEPV